MSGVVLPRTREERLVVEGREYRIFVAWPSEPAPAAGFPLFYVLDANAAFATLVEALRMRSHRRDATGVGPAVVVGIAYPGDGPYMRERRTFDFTPPEEPGAVQEDGGDGRVPAAVGGGPRFLQMLQDEVTAIVTRDHVIDRTQRTIVGHSLAGYFVLDTLVSSPDAFSTYLAISPSIWWDRARLMSRAAALVASPPPRLQVRITVGEYEQRLAPWQVGKPPVGTVAERRRVRRMLDHARDLAQTLAAVPGLYVDYEVLGGEDHASVVPRSLSEGLRFAFAVARRDGLET